VARTKEFDPGTVLDAALELFWLRGYEATSMADLVAHLGVGRASIYATYRSKHDLYLKALERYVRAKDADLVRLLSQPGPVLPAIQVLLRLYASQDEPRRGCLVVNAACELLPGDAQVARQVEMSWEMLETALASALTRAQAQGELAPDSDPRALARFLLVVLQGLRVAAKGGSHPARLDAAIEQAQAVLV
jgi:TetR/AcrR family transcriptional regulator, transcriptional repressor for nem operon